jgi:hypothetical protein
MRCITLSLTSGTSGSELYRSGAGTPQKTPTLRSLTIRVQPRAQTVRDSFHVPDPASRPSGMNSWVVHLALTTKGAGTDIEVQTSVLLAGSNPFLVWNSMCLRCAKPRTASGPNKTVAAQSEKYTAAITAVIRIQLRLCLAMRAPLLERLE